MNATHTLDFPRSPGTSGTAPAKTKRRCPTSRRREASRPGAAAPDTASATATSAVEDAAAATASTTEDAAGTRTAQRDTDGMAVASFVLGLAGLLVFNLILGPCALVLGGLALLRGTGRRGRALLGTALGAADLIVLAAVTAADHSVSWSLAG